MTQYFAAANIWLGLALVAILGCTNRNTMGMPTARSSFLSGPDMDASSYTIIVVAMFAISASFFVLTWMTRKNRDA
jgi:phosphotransferase system  glucose/maltose/N-acetylglucosamine-specific IIC component